MPWLQDRGLGLHTIVVFTSDHGDLMGEHRKLNKGNPYEASAKVPFVIRYPGNIQAGKVIHSAMTTVDFTPTILGIMGVQDGRPEFHGRDSSVDFVGEEAEVRSDRIVYLTHAGSRWVAAVNQRYKLVLSVVDIPWLYDLEKDPDELINYYPDPAYQPVARQFMTELRAQMKRFNEPALEHGQLIYDADGAWGTRHVSSRILSATRKRVRRTSSYSPGKGTPSPPGRSAKYSPPMTPINGAFMSGFGIRATS